QAWMPEFRAGDVVHEEPVPNVPIDANGLMREIPDEECDLAGRIHHTGVGAHAGARTAVRVEGDTRPNAPLLERPISPVFVEQIPLRVFCNVEIGPSILVVIQLHDAKDLSRDRDEARLFRSLCERAVAVVLVKARWNACVLLRGAIDFFTLVLAVDVLVGRPIDVVSDIQVQMPVTIRIEEHGGPAPLLRTRDPGLSAHFGEDAAVIAEEHILVQGREEEILIAVVVEVGHNDPEAIGLDVPEAGLMRGFDEGAVALIAKKPETLHPAVGPLSESPAANQQDVEPPIPVVVDEASPTPDDLRRPCLTESTIVVVELTKTRLLGDVGEGESRGG